MKKKFNLIILCISALSFITLIISLSLLLGEHLQVKSCGCPKMVSQNFIVLFILLSVIFIGGLIYYLFSLQIEKKEEKVKFNINTLMKFLDKDEKQIIQQLKKNNNKIFQSNLKGNKVRISRAIKKLKEKDIVKIEKQNKKNKIKLNRNFEIK
ncbi:MAG: hypothetical protein ACOCUU_02555 [Nanoarchaeota archaeon]